MAVNSLRGLWQDVAVVRTAGLQPTTVASSHTAATPLYTAPTDCRYAVVTIQFNETAGTALVNAVQRRPPGATNFHQDYNIDTGVSVPADEGNYVTYTIFPGESLATYRDATAGNSTVRFFAEAYL